MLNYGDAVAHLHIARRVFDCHQPRLSQLGSVWLPLPHMLMLPFVQVYSWWANGFAGIDSLGAGLCCRLRGHLPAGAALAAAHGRGAGAGLLRAQSQSALSANHGHDRAAVCLRDDLDRGLAGRVAGQPGRRPLHDADRLLLWIAAVLVAAIFTRYDGWIMALIAWTAHRPRRSLRRGQLRSRTLLAGQRRCGGRADRVVRLQRRGALATGSTLRAGPTPPRPSRLRTASHGAGPPHPGWHNPWVSLLFFVKASEMDAAAAAWGNVLLALSAAGNGVGAG